MQTTVNHKGKEVSIDLTPEQEAKLLASEKDIMSLIDSWEDVLKTAVIDKNEQILLDYNGNNPRLRAVQNELMLRIVCDTMNEGWVWEPGQEGWLPIFNLQNVGFAFSLSTYVVWGSGSAVGSRRCLRTEELANFCAKKFPQIFKYIILNK